MSNNFLVDDHTLDIFKAALPHVTPQAQGGMNLLLKANELMATIEEMNHPAELSAMEINEEEHTPEVLLTSIKCVCNQRETEIVDMMLNFFKARKIYSAYQDYGSQVLQAAQVNQNQSQNSNPFNMGNLFGMGGSGNIMDMLMSFMSPEQRNMFEMVNMMISTMNMSNMDSNMMNSNMNNVEMNPS